MTRGKSYSPVQFQRVVLRQRSFPRSYELGRRVAVGGMGEVYEGFARDLDRQVAVKRMLKSDVTDLQELFLREVAVCATLEHPNVVEVIDAGTLGPDLYLIMEFVDGPSLAELIEAAGRQGQKLPVEVTCGVIAQVARGLAHAHERAYPDGTSLGILHRDVAAENVLITRTGLPKLVDFGLATLSGHNLTTPGTIRGRPRALSPEQARGEKIDVRSDIFALGAMMFELASGEQLYPYEAIATMLWKVTAGDYEPIGPRLGGVDPDLVEIIQTAIEVDPRNRWRSARELERALDAFRAARGLRIDSGRIAAVVTQMWDEIARIREERKEESPGELEGQELTLAADQLDMTTASIHVPDYIASAGRAIREQERPILPAQPLSARPKQRISSSTPSRPRPTSTTFNDELVVTPGRLPKPREGAGYASYPGQKPTSRPDQPPLDRVERPISSPPASLRRSPRPDLGSTDMSPAPEPRDEPAPKPTPPSKVTRPAETRFSLRRLGGDRAWLVFLGILLLIALIVFFGVWLDDASSSPALVNRVPTH
jgi:serine/threonine protein kinase